MSIFLLSKIRLIDVYVYLDVMKKFSLIAAILMNMAAHICSPTLIFTQLN